MQLVTDPERRTSAFFIGEPTGGSPNHYGDALFAGEDPVLKAALAAGGVGAA